MRKTNTLIFVYIALKQTKAGPRSSETPFLVTNNLKVVTKSQHTFFLHLFLAKTTKLFCSFSSIGYCFCI